MKRPFVLGFAMIVLIEVGLWPYDTGSTGRVIAHSRANHDQCDAPTADTFATTEANKLYRSDVRECLHPADLSGDCHINTSDLKIMADEWLSGPGNLKADLYQDNRIDFKDYAKLTDKWNLTLKRWYVSPTGSPSADGSEEKPWDLTTALGGSVPISPGDTVWLAGGTYNGPFTKTPDPSGTPDAPIIYRARPGQRATITADKSTQIIFTNEAAYVWFWGLEVTADGDPNVMPAGGSAVKQMPKMGCKYINVVVHDCPYRNGFAIWGIGTELYGCLSYRNGRYKYGHGFYCQNRPRDVAGSVDDLPWMKFIDCIAFDNYRWGIHNYAESPKLANILYDGMVVYANRERNFDSGGRQHDDNFIMRDSFTYFPNGWPSAQFGYHSDTNGRLIMENNVFVAGAGALSFNNWEQVTCRYNTLYTATGGLLRIETPDHLSSYDIDNNTYYHSLGCFMLLDGIWRHTLEQWQAATGWDDNSTYTPVKPDDVWVFLRPNKYEPDRANLIIYNWPNTGTVSIDLAGLWDLRQGEQYSIVGVEDIWREPAAEGAWDGQPIDLPITGLCAPEFVCYSITRRMP